MKEMVDKDVGKKEKSSRKRRWTLKDVGKEEGLVPILHKPEGQYVEEQKRLER